MMNAQTRLSAKGQVVIPKDVRERLRWASGTKLELVEQGEAVSLRPVRRNNPFPPTTTQDVLDIPRWPGPAKSTEEISSLSNEALREIFAEQERRACD
jgi:AbrB family looped-hinge helix DNA binding protein